MALVGWSDTAFGVSVDARKVPFGLCDRLDVVDTEESASYFAGGLRNRQEDGDEQAGR